MFLHVAVYSIIIGSYLFIFAFFHVFFRGVSRIFFSLSMFDSKLRLQISSCYSRHYSVLPPKNVSRAFTVVALLPCFSTHAECYVNETLRRVRVLGVFITLHGAREGRGGGEGSKCCRYHGYYGFCLWIFLLLNCLLCVCACFAHT